MLEDLHSKLEQCNTRTEIDKFIKKHRKVQMIGDFLINEAEDKIKSGEYDIGITILLAVNESPYLKDVYDNVTLYLRLAEYYLENDDEDKGERYLIRLCNETVDNYEGALEFRKLLPIWEKYKHLVLDCVKPSVVLENERKAVPNPEYLLNELLEEVGSGGFESYLSYHSEYFSETIKAAEILNKPQTAALLKHIAERFPNGEVPNNPEKAEAIIMDNSLDFESEDEYFYEVAEKELVHS